MKIWQLKTKIIYEDDYKTDKGYENAIGLAEEKGWEYLTQSTGYNNHGGYCINKNKGQQVLHGYA